MKAIKFLAFFGFWLMVVFGWAAAAHGKTFVVPHFIEKQGLVSTTPNTFDTQFFVTYSGGIGNTDPTPGAMVDLYFFDDLTGMPLKSLTNVDVCNPCSFSVTAANRKAIGNVEGIANSVGGLPRPNVTGYMIFDVIGDVDNVDVSSFVLNSHTSATDLSTATLFTGTIQPDPRPEPIATYTLFPSIREDSKLPNEPFSFSQNLNLLYSGGLPGTTNGNGATVNLRIYDDLTGTPLLSMTNQPVCNPCSVMLSNVQRKHLFSFDTLIRNAGGFPRPDITGFTTVEVTGDTNNVSMENIATNNHTSQNDLEFLSSPRSRFGEPVLLPTNQIYVIPHVLEKQGTINNTQFTFDSSLFMTYTGGLPGFPAGAGATIDLYLFNQATGQVLKSATNQDVCNPCTTNLSPMNRKRIITLDDEIVAKGGFPTPVVLGFAIATVSNDDANVNMINFVVNSHTSAFDLAVFGFEPQPINAAPTSFQSQIVSDFLNRTNAAPEALPRTLSSEYNFSHFRDRTGKISNTTFTFDSEFHATYTGNQTATLNLYLYDQLTSAPLLSMTNQPVCNPCSLPMNSTTRKRQIIIDDLITAAGGFPRPDVAGFAKIKVSGDAGSVGILGTLVNSHTGPNDLSTSLLPSRFSARRTTDFDFDGDGKADLGVFRPLDPNGSTWYIQQSGDNQFRSVRWGLPFDTPVPQDYDNDGKTDIAVWRPDAPNFWIMRSSTSSVHAENFGQAGDNPSVTADFDGDGKADPAVYRDGASPGAQSYFYYRGSFNNPNGNITFIPWGINGDKPLRGDFDGDGKADPTVFRPSNQMWYIFESRTNALRAEFWGLATDTFVPADYDGDGKTDLAVFRNGQWHIRQSSNDFYRLLLWGIINDKPIPADFDGDGRVDIAVFRQGVWYVFYSSGGFQIFNFGLGGDFPIPSF